MMNQITIAILTAIGLFGGMLILLQVGRRIGRRRLALDPDGASLGIGAVDGAVFALLGLLIAFTFSGAASRFDQRRALVVEEANDIGTAWLRLDLLPTAAQPALRDEFRRYLESRIEAYRKMPDIDAAFAELARSVALQGRIWDQAVAASRAEGASPDAAKLLLPALNAMIDITSTRTMAARLHPPPLIYVMLVVLALASALFAGYGMAGARTRSWLHEVGFALVTALALYMILDIEFPRLGIIRVDAFDQALVEVLTGMQAHP
ncbi:DUF4239 domain-containing protein [uncultured Thiodictyon sp.]|uniref:bestrophin-like domain n=1 Tax=uncultured Thiodictyon sp. TaxID=1846217 RepID=UPI0025CCA93F|nr:DUF4239 domain-containing protein [uncultured Thiodictyon sp.]